MNSPYTNHKFINIILLSVSAITVFVLPVTGMNDIIYWPFVAVIVLAALISIRYSPELFSTILFFTLIHASVPINDKLTEITGIGFPGTYYLFPILVFSLLILISPKIRKTIGWWRKNTFDKTTILVIILLSIVSGASLYLWGKFIALDADLRIFLNKMPDVSLLFVIINGIGFAILNSIAEEFLSRGMLWNGLEKITDNNRIIVITQAVIFGVFHYHGFPGGLTGVILVIFWSVALGIIRIRTKGLAGVVIGHFSADLSIYFILYSMK